MAKFIEYFIEWDDIIRGLPTLPQLEDLNHENIENETTNFGNTAARGWGGYMNAVGTNYRIAFKKSNVVHIIDKTLKGKKKIIMRFDKPHAHFPHEHININRRVSGIKDPHIPLPSGSNAVITRAGQVARVANKALVAGAVAIDTYRTGSAIYSDYNNRTSRRTVETVSNIAGGWGGGYGGAMAGAALGSSLLPGVGTIIGGIIGGIAGGVGGSVGTEKLTSTVFDKIEYDLRRDICRNCNRQFEIRLYLTTNTRNTVICYFCENDNFALYIFSQLKLCSSF